MIEGLYEGRNIIDNFVELICLELKYDHVGLALVLPMVFKFHEKRYYSKLMFRR